MQWDTLTDEKIFITFRSAMNQKNGEWKSAKQALYFVRNFAAKQSASELQSFFGIELGNDEYAFFARGMNQFYGENADGTTYTGKRGSRHILRAFICDGMGVNREYKIPFQYFRSGSAPNPQKTVVTWKRESSSFNDVLSYALEGERQREKEKEKEYENAEYAPNGRVELNGIILSMKEKYTEFGITLKMLFKDDRGFKVWSTVPAQVRNHAEKGNRLRFVARLTTSDNDPKFAFASRPSKAQIVEE